MSSDYKYNIQTLAEELAVEEFGEGFYELTNDQQSEVYTKAEQFYWESKVNYGL